MRAPWPLVVALTVIPDAAWPQGNPVGPEFRVNSYTTGNQAIQAVAADPSGNFVVVWWGQGQEETNGVFGQRFDSSGTPLGAQFHVNTFTTNVQNAAVVAVDSSGNFVVAWHSLLQDGSSYGIFGQRYTSSGAPLGLEFRVNSYTTGRQDHPSIAADAAGNFVVVWEGITPDGSYDAFGQRYASSGAPLGSEFRINTYTAGTQGAAFVAADPAGNFLVTWQSLGQDGSSDGLFAQRYGSSGAALGPEFRVNTYTTDVQGTAFAAADSSGNFVVVWASNMQDGSNYGVFGQRYANSGAPLGAEFRVNTHTTSRQSPGGVAADPSGNFVVVWNSLSQDGSNLGVFGQRFASSGTPLGPEFRVNSYTTGFQAGEVVAVDSTGRFVVVWGSNLQDGSAVGVFGQRYDQIVPVELMHFRVE